VANFVYIPIALRKDESGRSIGYPKLSVAIGFIDQRFAQATAFRTVSKSHLEMIKKNDVRLNYLWDTVFMEPT
jgi:hypothetical protein